MSGAALSSPWPVRLLSTAQATPPFHLGAVTHVPPLSARLDPLLRRHVDSGNYLCTTRYTSPSRPNQAYPKDLDTVKVCSVPPGTNPQYWQLESVGPR